MCRVPKEIAGRELASAEQFRREVLEDCQPVILRALVSDWPAVQAGRGTARDLKGYLAAFDVGARAEVFFGEPSIGGKYYYGAGLEGFNFERRTMPLLEALELAVETLGSPGGRSMYIGSVPLGECLPGFASANPMPWLPAGTGGRIWLGHAADVSSHYDTFDNLACVIAGRRRFTLYAPQLIGRLYMGPIDHTMSGATVRLAASAPAGSEGQFPLFEPVRAQALVAELEPGDALYLPKLWWHQVQSTAPFNGLVNFWWDAFSSGPDTPFAGLLLAMITIAERPPAERQAWRAFFEHFVFRAEGHPLRHLPSRQHGLLGPLKPDNYARIRARIARMLRAG